MKLIKEIKEVKQFYMYNNEEVVVKSKNVIVGEKEFNTEENYDYIVWNNVLTYTKPIGFMQFIQYKYNGEQFEQESSHYQRNFYFNSETYLSRNYADGIDKVSLSENGKNYFFEIEDEKHSNIPHYSFNYGILLLTSNNSILFYTKTGERLWEYKEEDENLKINGRCIPVVDDVVVVISEDCGEPEKIQGFNIRTGKKLWVLDSRERRCPNTFFCGEDNLLYGCYTEELDYDDPSRLILTILNPTNGNVENIEVGTACYVMAHLVTMHGNKLYYADNRRGGEIGVIDVNKKELVERFPLNIKKYVNLGAPVVTDDKVYVFIRDLQELRVYENIK